MAVKLLLGDDIRNQILRILSGACFLNRKPDYPKLYILSPWISDVEIELTDINSLKDQGAIDYFILEYNIKSINLLYALLLLRLHSGIEINIVTLPPNEMNYPMYLSRVQTLLDFLDEIDCSVFVNSKLHSKLLLANDLALLGSFNLSSSALYDREEIGVSIDDLENLDRLEKYCINVIRQSQRYGYSSLLNWGSALAHMHVDEHWDYSKGFSPQDAELFFKKVDEHIERESLHTDRYTRGHLLDILINAVSREGSIGERYRDFLNVTGGYDKFIKSYSSNLNLFYLLSLRRLISSPEGKSCVKGVLGYEGDESIDSIMEFVNSKFARKASPDVKLRIKSLQ